MPERLETGITGHGEMQAAINAVPPGRPLCPACLGDADGDRIMGALYCHSCQPKAVQWAQAWRDEADASHCVNRELQALLVRLQQDHAAALAALETIARSGSRHPAAVAMRETALDALRAIAMET